MERTRKQISKVDMRNWVLSRFLQFNPLARGVITLSPGALGAEGRATYLEIVEKPVKQQAQPVISKKRGFV